MTVPDFEERTSTVQFDRNRLLVDNFQAFGGRTMRCTLAGTVGTWLLAWAALTAADFWQEKDFTVWSAQQVEKMLTESPWAKKVTIVVGGLREEVLGGFQRGTSDPGGGVVCLSADCGALWSPDSGSAEFQRVRRVTVMVAWISGLPFRQALVRGQTGPDAPIPLDQQRQLREDQPFYTLAVIGLPLRLAAQGGTIDELKSKTALKPNRKDRIAPADIRAFGDGDHSVRVEFLFPKANAIALGDKEVEFITKLGNVELTKKFKLADMMVGGRLAL
jgi:hypothetical protein